VVVDGFSALAREKLGWYVYMLCDPRSGAFFYIGKGRGDRAFQHEGASVANIDHPELQSAKAARINEIVHAQQNVKVSILRHGIASEQQAYEVESAAIDVANALAPDTLLNAVLGHHHAERGLMSAGEIEIVYAAHPAPALDVPVILVSLNQLWHPNATEAELKEMTSGWWNTRGTRRDRAQYVLGVHNGVVRTVYRPTNWRPRGPEDRDWQHDDGKPARWGFIPESAPEMAKYLRTSVARFLTSNQWSHRYVGPESADG
jgi:uncharacterized protein